MKVTLCLAVSFFFIQAAEAKRSSFRRTCRNLIEAVTSYAESEPLPYLKHPYFYRIERGRSFVKVFVTSPSPVPLSFLYGDFKRAILYDPDLWVGVDFEDKQARAQQAAYRSLQKKKASHSPISKDLSPDVQYMLADQVVRERTETGSFLKKLFQWKLKKEWRQNFGLSPGVRNKWIASLIDPLTPYEAYLLMQRVQRENEMSSRRLDQQSMERQLLKFKRKPAVRDFLNPWERQRWYETQFHNMTANDLAEILLHRPLDSEMATSIYLSGDEAKAHEIMNEYHENFPNRLRMGQDYLIKQILKSKISELFEVPGRPVVFINFKQAFGDLGLFKQLEKEGFRVTRLK